MAAPVSKRAGSAKGIASTGERRYPPEAYTYDDDVTPEAVAAMREKASKVLAADEWEVVDGFGADEPAAKMVDTAAVGFRHCHWLLS